MKKLLLFVALMFAVNVLIGYSTSSDLWAKKAPAKAEKAEKGAKSPKAEKAAKAEDKAPKEAKSAAKADKGPKAAQERKGGREEKVAQQGKAASQGKAAEGQQFRGADGRTYIQGPRGGCYYVNDKGNKVYVDHSKCK